MTNQEKTYTVYNNQLSIPASLLYDEWGIISYENYMKKCHRGQLVRTRMGKGKGNFALLSYYDLPNHIKALCIEKLGDYKKMKIQTI